MSQAITEALVRAQGGKLQEKDEKIKKLERKIERLQAIVASYQEKHKDALLAHSPPHNVEAERAVLGAVFIDQGVLAALEKKLEPEDFYRPGHGVLYETMLDLWRRGAPVDPVALLAELREKKRDDYPGVSPSDLASLASVVVTAANAEYHAGLVREQADLRHTINELALAQREIFEAKARPAEVVSAVRRRLDELAERLKVR